MKRTNRYSLFCSLALALLAPLTAQAEYKIVTVDLNRILNESSTAKEQRKSLDAMSTQAKTKIEAKKKTITAMEKNIKEKGLGEDSKEVQEIGNEIKNFNRLVKDSEDEIKKEFLKINKSLTEKALKIINQYAEKKDIDLVIDRSEKSRGPVLFGDPGSDITPEIIKELDKA